MIRLSRRSSDLFIEPTLGFYFAFFRLSGVSGVLVYLQGYGHPAHREPHSRSFFYRGQPKRMLTGEELAGNAPTLALFFRSALPSARDTSPDAFRQQNNTPARG
jgi:hypothetical protein